MSPRNDVLNFARDCLGRLKRLRQPKPQPQESSRWRRPTIDPGGARSSASVKGSLLISGASKSCAAPRQVAMEINNIAPRKESDDEDIVRSVAVVGPQCAAARNNKVIACWYSQLVPQNIIDRSNSLHRPALTCCPTRVGLSPTAGRGGQPTPPPPPTQ